MHVNASKNRKQLIITAKDRSQLLADGVVAEIDADLHSDQFAAESCREELMNRTARNIRLLALQPQCTVAMEACTGSHYWGREIARLGHEVRLIPPS